MRYLLRNVVYPVFEKGKIKYSLGDIVIDNGIIEEIGTKLRTFYDFLYDFNKKAFVTPGFVNSHVHPKLEAVRSISPGEPWEKIRVKIHAVEGLLSKEEFNLFSTLNALNNLSFGSTTIFAVSSFPDEVLKGLNSVPMRKVLFIMPKDVWYGERNEIVIKEDLNKIKRIVEEFVQEKNPLLRTGLGIASLTGASDDLLEYVMKTSEKYDKLVQIHVSQSEADVKLTKRIRKKREIEYLDKIGFLNLGENLLLVHSLLLSKKEIKLIKENKNYVVLCPSSNMRLGSGIPIVYNYNISKVLLGTDNPLNSDTDSILSVAWLLLLSNRGINKDGFNPTPEEIYRFLVINPYRLIRRLWTDNIGEVKEGFVADLAIFDFKDVGVVYNPIWTLVHNPNWKPRYVFVKGKLLIEDGDFRVNFVHTWIYRKFGIRNYHELKNYLLELFFEDVLPELSKLK